MTREELRDDAVERLLDVARADLPDVDLGKYELVREIGRGGMGIVYEAQDEQLGRAVAVKLIADHAGTSPIARARFLREAAAAGKLQHPHIAQVYEATPDYIAMQLVRGASLDACALDAREAAAVMRDAARAVHYAHEHGIVHRDLKPSNLLLAAEHVYVMDFGLAKEVDVESDLSRSGHVLGSPGFMSPEQAQGRGREVDVRSDVYGLGATLWSVLAGGAPPFGGDDVLDVLRQVVEREPPKLRGVDADLRTIALHAMEKEPGRRYATAAEFADDLERWLGGRPIVARPPSAAYRVSRFLRRHRNVVRIAAGIMVVTIALLWNERQRLEATRAGLGLSNTVGQLMSDAEDQRRVGDAAQHVTKLREAASACMEFLERNDEIGQAHYLLGRVLRLLGEHAGARDAFDRALALDPRLGEARFERGLLLLEWADDAREQASAPAAFARERLCLEAGRDLRDAFRLGLSLRTVDQLYGKARLALLDGEVDTARAALDRVVDLDDRYAPALELLADPELRLVGAEERMRWSARLLDVSRGFVPGSSRSDPGESPQLVRDEPLTTRGLLADVPSVSAELPRDVLDHAFRGLRRVIRAARLREQGQGRDANAERARALADLDFALRIDPERPLVAALNNRAVVRMRIALEHEGAGDVVGAFGARQLARADLDRAIEAEPGFAIARINRAIVCRAQAARQRAGGEVAAAVSNDAQARRDLSAALRALPNDWPRRRDLEALRARAN